MGLMNEHPERAWWHQFLFWHRQVVWDGPEIRDGRMWFVMACTCGRTWWSRAN